MKRFILLGMVLILLTTLLPISSVSQSVYAQSDDLPACTTEELGSMTEGLILLKETLDSINDIGDSPQSEEYLTTLIALDEANYAYWHTYYPEFPKCLEVQKMSNVLGLVLDETLATVLIYRYASIQDDEELVEYFENAALARSENLFELIAILTEPDALSEVLLSEWEACTDAEIETTDEALQEAYDKGSLAFAEGGGAEGLLPVVMGYEALTIEYWRDTLPLLPECYEVQALAYQFGFITEDMLIVLIITELSKYEAYAGNSEPAQTLLTSGNQRLSDLEEPIEFLQEMFGNTKVSEE